MPGRMSISDFGVLTNNTRWVPISDVVDSCWFGKKLSELTAAMRKYGGGKGPYYEVSRDKPADDYCWYWRDSKKQRGLA